MHILISPTAFKGTFTPYQAARLIHASAQKNFPKASFRIFPLADGGDGTLEVLNSTLNGKIISTRVKGPLGKPVTAQWSLIGKTAVIEMARASGLALVKGRNRIMDATTFGTGQLIKTALDKGCRKILMGVGGTATSDGGAGALQALGLRYFDKSGRVLSGHPSDLASLARIDWENFDLRIFKTEIVVLCDVTNPLLGSNGSARTFGPQKGATPSQVKVLEKILKNWADHAPRNVRNKPGAGAAGGMAFGLAAFAGARLVKGTSYIMDAVRWGQAAKRSNLIITGEGRLDKTSFQGKVIGEILKRRGRARVMTVCGSNALSPKDLEKKGIMFATTLRDFL